MVLRNSPELKACVERHSVSSGIWTFLLMSIWHKASFLVGVLHWLHSSSTAFLTPSLDSAKWNQINSVSQVSKCPFRTQRSPIHIHSYPASTSHHPQFGPVLGQDYSRSPARTWHVVWSGSKALMCNRTCGTLYGILMAFNGMAAQIHFHHCTDTQAAQGFLLENWSTSTN